MGGLTTPDARPDPALHVRPSALVAVAVGGLVGTTARYLLTESFPAGPDAWPAVTFAINVAGALLLGLLLESLIRLGPDTSWRRVVRLGAGTGALGSFTTYSTFAVEVDRLVRDGSTGTALSYAAGTVVAGLVATALGVGIGVWAGARWRRSRR